MPYLLLILLLSSACLTTGCNTPDDPPPTCDDMALITDFQGLWLNPNPLNAPPGSATTALNVVSTRKGAAECRPGQESLPGSFATSGERLRTGRSYGGYNFEHTGVSLYRRNLSAGTLTKVADSQPPDGPLARMRFAVAGDDLYMATSTGIQVMDGATATPVVAGFDPMLDPDAPISSTTTPTWIPNGSSVAYRAVVIRNDAEGRVQYGPPSSRRVFTNASGATASTYIYVNLPASAKVGDFVQLYRTSTAASGVNPGDVMGLIAEVQITSAHIADFRRVRIDDHTPDGQIGAGLYTNSTSAFGGITMANSAPPFGSDVAFYKQSLFVANTKGKHQFLMSIIAAPSSTTQLTVDGVTGTISFVPTGSVAGDIEAYARAVVNAWNALPIDMRAYYVSGEYDPPGRILFERPTPLGAAFTVSSTDGQKFAPNLTTPVPSTQDVRLNGLDVSKPGLPYAFPSNSAYHLRLGAADAKILRIIANRDSLFVFKEDGIWVVFPSGQTFDYRQISTDVVLLFPDSVAVMDNQVYAFTNQGLVAVDESGIEHADDAIRQATQAIQDAVLSAAGGPSPASLFAVSDTTRLQYTLWHANTSGTGTAADHALVYNGTTDVWTERDDLTTGGYFGADGLLYLGSATGPSVTRQRNTGTASDYQGPFSTPINVQIEWLKLLNPAGVGQFTELRLLTEEPTSGPYSFTFTSHYGESASTTGEGEGLPEVRVWVPDDVQRTTRLKARVSRNVLSEYLVVLGVADTAEDTQGPPTRG